MRCVFSNSLNGSTLGVPDGSPPGVTVGNRSGGPSGGEGVGRAVGHNVFYTSSAATVVAVRAILDDVVTTLFPADCRACRGPLVRAGLAPVCDDCLSRISLQSWTLCWRCGEALGMENDRFAGQFAAEDVLCTTCRFVPPPFERATAFGMYEDELRTLIHLLKYERVRAAARPLGRMLAQAINILNLSGDVAVIAVPLFPAKERQRGYNQAVLLADAAIRLVQKPGLQLRAVHSSLRRVRDTESQFALSSKGRRTNLRGAFTASAISAISGRTVLLIDDIYTTGATARECARVLVRAGAARVFIATLARAQTKRVERWDAGFEVAKFEVSGNGLVQTGRIAT